MIQVLQDLDGIADDLVRLAALDIDDETNATGVMFELWIVKTLLPGRATQDAPAAVGRCIAICHADGRSCAIRDECCFSARTCRFQ